VLQIFVVVKLVRRFPKQLLRLITQHGRHSVRRTELKYMYCKLTNFHSVL
jgi:hypothetical protein